MFKQNVAVTASVGLVYKVRDWYEHWYQIADQSSMT